MGLKRFIRKIVPREIRDNPLVAVVAVVALGPVALGAIGASTASIVGATVAANTATAIAIGTGVVTTGITFAQTQDVSDSLKAGVRAGVGSAVGSAVSSSVTNAVAGQTGASLADLEPALRELPSQAGISGSLAGAASITAGNVAGEAARAAITGRPIEEGALLGLAGSIPQSLSMAPEFNSLHPIVQNVVASSAQAAVRGQDVGDAALTALITSSKIVSRAINELPGGQDLIRENPRFTKYIIDSVSSALAAQLQGKDVSESVIQRLVMTTAEIIGQEIESAQESGKLQQAQATYTEAQQKEQQIQDATAKLNSLMQTPENANLIARYNNLNEYLQSVAVENQQAIGIAEAYINLYNSGFISGETAKFQVDNAVARAKLAQDSYNTVLLDVYDLETKLTRSGFRAQYNELTNKIQALNGELTALTNTLQAQASDLAQSSASFFEDLSTEFATTIAPLTAFEDVTDVGDQDVLAQIQPVAPPTELVQAPPPAAPTEVAQTPAPPVDPFAYTPPIEVAEAPSLVTELPQEGLVAEGPVTDQELLAEMQPVAPPTQITGLDPTISAQAEDIAREEFAKVAQGEQVAALPAVAIPAAANVLTRTAIQAAPAVVRRVTQFAANDPRFAQAVVENPYIQELLRAASLTAAIGQNGELLIQPIIQQNESAAETARLYRYATEVQSQAVNIPARVVQALDREARRFEELAMQEDIENLLAPQPDMEVELTPETISPTQPIPEIDVRPAQPAITPSPVEIPQVVPEEVSPLPELLPGIVPQPQPIPAPAPITTPLPRPQPVPITEPAPRPSPLPQPLPEPAPVPAEEPARRTDVEVAPIPAEELGLLPQTRLAEEPMPRPAAETAPQVRPEEPQTVTRPVDFPEDITDDEIMRIIEEDLGEPLDLGPEEEEAAPEEEGVVTPEPAPTAEGEEGAEPSPEIVLPTARVTTVGRRTFQRPGEAAPYRVTGMDESGILGRKQPLFGGDEDLQRAEWNRRSLRLRRLLGL